MTNGPCAHFLNYHQRKVVVTHVPTFNNNKKATWFPPAPIVINLQPAEEVVTGCIDEGNTVGIVYLNLGEACGMRLKSIK